MQWHNSNSRLPQRRLLACGTVWHYTTMPLCCSVTIHFWVLSLDQTAQRLWPTIRWIGMQHSQSIWGEKDFFFLRLKLHSKLIVWLLADFCDCLKQEKNAFIQNLIKTQASVWLLMFQMLSFTFACWFWWPAACFFTTGIPSSIQHISRITAIGHSICKAVSVAKSKVYKSIFYVFRIGAFHSCIEEKNVY